MSLSTWIVLIFTIFTGIELLLAIVFYWKRRHILGLEPGEPIIDPEQINDTRQLISDVLLKLMQLRDGLDELNKSVKSALDYTSGASAEPASTEIIEVIGELGRRLDKLEKNEPLR